MSAECPGALTSRCISELKTSLVEFPVPAASEHGATRCTSGNLWDISGKYAQSWGHKMKVGNTKPCKFKLTNSRVDQTWIGVVCGMKWHRGNLSVQTPYGFSSFGETLLMSTRPANALQTPCKREVQKIHHGTSGFTSPRVLRWPCAAEPPRAHGDHHLRESKMVYGIRCGQRNED